MGRFAKHLRARGHGGGKNVVDDPVEKKRFAEEIREMFDPVEVQRKKEADLEALVLKSAREPTVQEVLEELARQAARMRQRMPNASLVCYCGGYAFALLSNVRSYPEVAMGLKIVLDRHIPPWDTVVMYAHHKGKKHGGVL